jgi:hypothetical protein
MPLAAQRRTAVISPVILAYPAGAVEDTARAGTLTPTRIVPSVHFARKTRSYSGKPEVRDRALMRSEGLACGGKD